MRLSDLRTLWACTFRVFAAVATGNREALDNVIDEIVAAREQINARRNAR